MGMDTVLVDTDEGLADRVQEALHKKISLSAAETVYAAFLSVLEEDKYMPLYHYIVLGFQVGRQVDAHSHNPYVLRVQKLARLVHVEAHRYVQFCRFKETKSGVFYSDITPQNDVLPLLASHFTDRFISHSWIIHDVGRGRALIYNGRECLLTDVPKEANVVYTENEGQMQDLWHCFYETIAIKERKNLKVQGQFMPKKYRRRMTEHQHPLKQANKHNNAIQVTE